MKNLENGCTWSGEQRKVYSKLKSVINQIAGAEQSNAFTVEEIVDKILEAASGHYTWGCDPEDVARSIERLARRVRCGERLHY